MNGHLRPRQPSAPTASSPQSVSAGSKGSSALSPVSVSSNHGRRSSKAGCVLLPAQQLAAEQLEAVQRLAAEVVLAALEHSDLHLTADRRSGDRHVLREQLLLESLRRRRHDHAAAGGERRDEVREALACARARFGEQMLASLERVGDGLGELGLLGTRLVARQDLGEGAPGSEHVVHAASVWRAAAVAGKSSLVA